MDLPHWQFPTRYIGSDEHGTWLGVRAGDSARKGDEPPVTFRSDSVFLVPDDSWWTSIWNSAGDVAGYVDITMPAVWAAGAVTMVDLDLDVAMWRDGRVEVLDEDEFEEHRSLLGYPPHVAAGARAATAEVVLAIEAGREPFRTAGPGRLAAWAH